MKGTKTIRVTHPLYGTYEAKGVRDKLQAVQAAAREWRLQWSSIARDCTFSSQSCEAPTEKGRTAEEVREDGGAGMDAP